MWRYVLVSCVCCLPVVSNYVIPAPTIEVHKTSGVRMFIPDSDDIEMVVFHVNLNKIIRDKEGDHTKYLLRPRNGSWVYENRALRLSAGDRLYFWIYVKKDGLGYIRGEDVFTVNEFATPEPTTPSVTNDLEPLTYPNHWTATTTRTPMFIDTTSTTTQTSKLNKGMRNCSMYVQNVTESLLILENQLKVLQEENAILKKIAASDDLRLNLSGIITLTGEPLDIVKFVLQEKLNLNPHVRNAWMSGNATITFVVYTLEDKLNIIKSANDKLQFSKQIKITY